MGAVGIKKAVDGTKKVLVLNIVQTRMICPILDSVFEKVVTETGVLVTVDFRLLGVSLHLRRSCRE